ncbi:MAG: right-handed parallel beta-helix repeat-containing protein, partial [Candidatus Pacebacteria bacterium]|nr:right-handed parallel beta-helix repeat-containing protein [Candidatus Paceibacterota bacterium]
MDCNSKIQSANAGNEVVLTTGIANYSGSCIDFAGKDEVIFNCDNNIISGMNHLPQIGIYLGASSDNNTIKNCIVKEFGTGIKIENSQGNKIIDTVSKDNLNTGIFLNRSNYNQLTNVSSLDNYHGFGNSCGFRIERSNNNTLDGIIASGNHGIFGFGGIYLNYASNNNLINLDLSNNEKYGIYIRFQSNHNTVRNAIITTFDNKQGGLYVYSSISGKSIANDIDTSNTINGKPIQFFDNYYNPCPSSGAIMEYGNTFSMVHLYNCNDITLRETSLESGLFLWSTNNSEIYNVVVSDNRDGVVMWNSHSNTFANITATNNSSSGIYMQNSDYNVFSDVISSYSDNSGVAVMSSDHNVFNDHTSNNNVERGFYLRYGNNNSINNSTIADNILGGFWFQYDSDHNTIKGCQIKNSLGISFYASSGYDPENNLIYNNYFENDFNFDFSGTGYSNIWNVPRESGINIVGGSELGGNYWAKSDGMGFSQTCDDIDLDGFCDSSFVLNADNVDLLPLTTALPSTHTISGTLNYFDGIKFIPDATVILEDEAGAPVGSTVSAVDGYYEFTDIPGGEDYVIRVEKEDSSIGVTGADITMIAKHIVGIEYFTSTFQTIASDV